MSEKENNFDKEFTTDGEVEEALDSLIIAVGKLAEKEDNRTSIINPDRIQHVIYAHKVLKYLTADMAEVKVSCELHKPYRSMGSVNVVGKNLEFSKPKLFMRAVEIADNVDIYPKTNGTIQMDFTFHGLTTPFK